MAESQAQRVLQLVKHPYFLPLSIILPATAYFLSPHLSRKPKLQPSKPHECRFRLDTDTSATITLPDGRKLGYAEYGAPSGRPILYMHGTPGSRIETTFWDELAKKHNARLIGVDRPGIGWSSPKKNPKVIEIGKDIEALTQHLGLEEYAVLGCSGGGPSTLACARVLPANKLKGISIVVGAGGSDMSWKGADLPHQLGFGWGIAAAAPWLARIFWRTNTLSQVHLSEEERCERFREEWFNGNPHPKDAELAKDLEWRDDLVRVVVRGMQEAFAHGVEAVTQDDVAFTSDWGMRIEDIRSNLPVQLWYGKYDTFVPPVIGEQIAERLKGRAELHIEDESHGSLQWNHGERILTDLLRTFDA